MTEWLETVADVERTFRFEWLKPLVSPIPQLLSLVLVILTLIWTFLYAIVKYNYQNPCYYRNKAAPVRRQVPDGQQPTVASQQPTDANQKPNVANQQPTDNIPQPNVKSETNSYLTNACILMIESIRLDHRVHFLINYQIQIFGAKI